MKPSEILNQIADNVEWVDVGGLALGRVYCRKCGQEAEFARHCASGWPIQVEHPFSIGCEFVGFTFTVTESGVL